MKNIKQTNLPAIDPAAFAAFAAKMNAPQQAESKTNFAHGQFVQMVNEDTAQQTAEFDCILLS